MEWQKELNHWPTIHHFQEISQPFHCNNVLQIRRTVSKADLCVLIVDIIFTARLEATVVAMAR